MPGGTPDIGTRFASGARGLLPSAGRRRICCGDHPSGRESHSGRAVLGQQCPLPSTRFVCTAALVAAGREAGGAAEREVGAARARCAGASCPRRRWRPEQPSWIGGGGPRRAMRRASGRLARSGSRARRRPRSGSAQCPDAAACARRHLPSPTGTQLRRRTRLPTRLPGWSRPAGRPHPGRMSAPPPERPPAPQPGALAPSGGPAPTLRHPVSMRSLPPEPNLRPGGAGGHRALGRRRVRLRRGPCR